MTDCHLVVGDRPYCSRTGCQAGLRIADKSGVSLCGYRSKSAAQEAASKLQPHYTVPVRVVDGVCPESGS